MRIFKYLSIILKSSSLFPILIIGVISVSIATGLFYIMAILIFQEGDLNIKRDDLSLDFFMSRDNSELRSKRRRAPKKKKAIAKPKMKQAKLVPAKFTPNALGTDISDLIQDGGVSNMGMGGMTPVVRIAPQYPVEAAMRGVEGFVLLKFDITKLGTVETIKILAAKPPRIFNRSAISALSRWKYKPKMRNNKPVKQLNNRTRIDFNLEK